MTDPNVPPPERPVVHHTTVNTPAPRSGGAGFIGFLVGGLVVVVIIIGVVLLTRGGGVETPNGTDVEINVDVPRPTLPDAPRLPDLPAPPPVEPPSVPNPQPAPAPVG